MARRLKVFRTPIGFHDAYVAAPSRKAALAAWGASADLFARGAAEEVTDPELTEAPLADPGTVIRRTRGSAEEHLAALPPDRPAAARARPKPRHPAPPRPRPRRDDLDAAEAALEAGRKEHEAGSRRIAARQRALDAERRKLDDTLAALEEAQAAADRAYREAMADWRAG